ncbi:MAG: restriction endonuclease subunit S [Gammaproteobacteria bacterium]|nr:restriction endonuclease subunit S [Gammaproteobacteria bacterium]
MSIPIVELGQICTTTQGVQIPKSETSNRAYDGGYRYLYIADFISDKKLSFVNDDYDNKKVTEGDLVMANTGSPGRVFKGKDGILSNNLFKISFDSEVVDRDYLYLILSSSIFQDVLQQQMKGGIQKHLGHQTISRQSIPLPPLEEQKRIAEILDKADAIRRKRQQAIDFTDQLLRSVFLDMFGDPVTNPKGFDTKTIEEFVSKDKYSIKRGPFGGALKKEIFVESGYLVYEQYHALNNDFSYQRYFIDENKFNELKAFEVKAGDIIISCSGVNLGRLAIVPDGSLQGIINQALLKLTLNTEVMLNEMFVSIFTHPNFKAEFFGYQRGSGVPNFPPMSTFKEFAFIVPPIELQKEYLRRVASVNSSRKKIRSMAGKSEELFSSLVQQAFRGELSKSTKAA